MIGAIIGAGVSIVGGIMAKNDAATKANEQSAATMKQMRLSAAADTASRKAEASSLIAQVEATEFKVQQLHTMKKTVQLQGKADTMLREQHYNETAAVAMVMGAASGRSMGSGSLTAIYDKSEEDYNFEQLWNSNNVAQTLMSLSKDEANIYKSNKTSLLLGAEGLAVNRQRSEAGLQMTSTNAKLAMDNATRAAQTNMFNAVGKGVAGAAAAYGSKYGNIFSKTSVPKYQSDNGWLY